MTIRTAALTERIPIMTTIRAATASAKGIRSLQKGALTVRSLQEYHAAAKTASVAPNEKARGSLRSVL